MIAIFPELANLVAAGDLENLACAVRRYFGGQQVYAPVLDVEELLKAVGITLQRLDIEGWGALVTDDKNGRFHVTAVVHPQLQVSSDRNLLLAHLLGHFLLHIQPALARGSELRQGFRELVMPCERLRGQGLASLTPEEQELEKAADDFACALLMPLGMVKRAHAKIGDSQRIASFFGVPQEVVQQRCLGLAPGAAAQQPPAAVPPGGGAAPTDQLASTDTHSQETQSPVAPKTTKNPSQPPADQDTQSAQALARGQRLLAGQRYRSQPQQRSVHDGQSAGDGADTQDSAKTSLRRIRELAKRLDSSVDLD